MPNWEHNEGRPATQKDVAEILARLDGPSTSNEPVLGINARRIMSAKNNGYPKDMYHATLDPVQALTSKKETALRALGYVEYYIPRTHPKMLFRRNMNDKYGPQIDPATKELVGHPWVEERIAKDPEAEKRIRAEKQIPGMQYCGPWVEKLDELEPLPDGPQEDPDTTIARLRGQLAVYEASQVVTTTVEKRQKRKGRPPKAKTDATLSPVA